MKTGRGLGQVMQGLVPHREDSGFYWVKWEPWRVCKGCDLTQVFTGAPWELGDQGRGKDGGEKWEFWTDYEGGGNRIC